MFHFTSSSNVFIVPVRFKYVLFFLPFSASVEVFLRFLQKEYQWSTNSVKTISSQLAKDDIFYYNKCRVACHVLERGTRTLSHWYEEDDRQRTHEARHD